MEGNIKRPIIIFGSAGLIGANLTHWLLTNTDHTVVGVDNLSGGCIENMPPISDRFTIVWGDMCNSADVNTVFERFNPSCCYLMSCYAAEARSNYIRSFIHANNTVGAANVINACVNHKTKLVFTSSVAVYSGTPPFNEATPPNPLDEYGLSKWTTERSIKIAGETQGLDWCIVRPRNVYGKYQNLFDEARNLMGIWMYQIRNNLPMTIFGDGSNKRCFTSVDEIIEPLYKAKDVSGEIINLGSPKAWTILEANKILQDITGYKKVIHTETRHEVPEAVCDTMASEILLGYEHNISLREGLNKMWEWAKTVPMRERQVPPPLEVNIKAHSSIK